MLSMSRCCLPVLLLAACLAVPAVEDDGEVAQLIAEIVADIPGDVLAEPGNTELPERLAELLEVDLGLAPAEELELRARVAEAWLGAEVADRAEAVARELLAASDEQVWRDRAGKVLVSAWYLQGQRAAALAAAAGEEGAGEGAEDPVPAEDAEQTLSQRLLALGDFSAPVVARARVLDGRLRLEAGAYRLAAAHFDGALAVLGRDPAQARARVPVYSWRVMAMEAAGDEAEAIVAWLRGFEGDPAVDLVLATLLTDSQKLVGRPAPELALPRLDGEGEWQLSAHTGSPTVIYVFATWCQPCGPITPEVVAFANERPEVDVVGLSLDNPDTVGRIDDYRARYGIEFPIIGESLGWDGEADDLLHVDAIPHIIVIGPEGRIAAVDLIKAEPEQTAAALRAAVDEILPAGAAEAQVPVAPIDGDLP